MYEVIEMNDLSVLMVDKTLIWYMNDSYKLSLCSLHLRCIQPIVFLSHTKPAPASQQVLFSHKKSAPAPASRTQPYISAILVLIVYFFQESIFLIFCIQIHLSCLSLEGGGQQGLLIFLSGWSGISKINLFMVGQ